MKLLVFAHIPPPHHGQSYMVQLMLEGFGGDRKRRSAQKGAEPGDMHDIQCYHVDARVSHNMEDLGGIRPGKILSLVRYCCSALLCRFRYGIETLYYVPGPAKRSSLLRDWMVMALVRPFFQKIVLHWHAFGLGHWAVATSEACAGSASLPSPVLFGRWDGIARKITKVLFRNCDLSIVLTEYNRTDAEFLAPRKTVVVPNGLPDPCPAFHSEVLPVRQRRYLQRGKDRETATTFLFLGHCIESKGLHDAARMVARFRQARSAPLRFVVAGTFPGEPEKVCFQKLLADLGISDRTEFCGFVAAPEKARLLAEADVLLFPTRYPGETFGLVILEAFAFGLPVLVTRWRGLPSLLPGNSENCIAPGDVEAGSVLLSKLSLGGDFELLRERFVQCYSLDAHLRRLAAAIRNSGEA